MPSLTTLMFFLGGFYLAAAAYSLISGKKPSNLLSITELNSTILSKGGGWGILIPLVDLLVLFYNLTYTSFWFVGILIHFFAWLFKWVWEEVIVAGGYFIFSIIWHYAIKWPWKVLLFSFTRIGSSLKLNLLWVGSLAIFSSLGVMFLGRYLVQTFELWPFLTYLFGILAIIPIGVGLSIVIQRINGKSSDEIKQGSRKFFDHLAFIVLAIFFIGLAEAFLIYIGTFTSLSPIFSTLFAGGNLLGALLILINSVVIIFSLAALPSFSSQYQGSNKDVVVDFFKYLIRNNWAKYIISAPAMLIPLLIACAIPYIITQGVSYMAGKVSNEVFELRLSQLTKTRDSIPVYNYADWLDVSKVSDDSLKGLQDKDRERINAKMSYASTVSTKNYLDEFYSAHSSEYGAAPVGAMIFLFNEFFKLENSAISTTPMPKETLVADTSELNAINSQTIPQIQQNQKEINSRISNFQQALNAVCNPKYIRPSTENTSTSQSQQNQVQEQEPTFKDVDDCERERNYYRDLITNSNKDKANADKQLARAQQVAKYLKEIYEDEKSNDSNGGASSKVAFLLISLWLCLLVGLAFGAAIPMFAQVNHHLYTSENNGDLYVMDNIRKANSLNPNQPLLGIILFSTLLYFGSSSEIPGISKIKDLLPPLPNLETLFKDSSSSSSFEDTSTNDEENAIDSDVTESTPVADTTAAVAEMPIFSTDEVDTQAEYNGSNFNYDKNLHITNGAPGSFYEVTVSYVVDENGYVTDVTPNSGHGYGLEEEIVSAIQRTSGGWKPAMKNGEAVRCRFENTFSFGEKN